MKINTKDLLFNIITVVSAGLLTAFAFHYFIVYNSFAPGGVSGVATMTAYLLDFQLGYLTLIFNIPIFIAVFFIVKKGTALALISYILVQSATLLILKAVDFPYYETEYNIVLASIAGGVVSGLGFGLMLKRFGASGGTYGIAAILRKKNPALSVVWVSFILDSVVVAAAFFVYGFATEPVLCTLLNLFIANKVSDMILEGIRTGFKYEIVTDKPEEIAAVLIEHLHGSVTRMPAEGMYSRSDKSVLVCIVRKRQMGEFHRIIKQFPDTFVYISKVSEFMGGRVAK